MIAREAKITNCCGDGIDAMDYQPERSYYIGIRAARLNLEQLYDTGENRQHECAQIAAREYDEKYPAAPARAITRGSLRLVHSRD